MTESTFISCGGLLLLGARSDDILGRSRIFIAGMALFTFGSLAAGLAQSSAWLIIARVFHGMGAAVAAPSTLALLTAHFPICEQLVRRTQMPDESAHPS